MRADLHSHSSVSDGTDPPADVMSQAAKAGLDVIALTDHDTVAGHAQAASALPSGLTLLPGAEVSCRLSGHSVHMLAYLFDPEHAGLAAELAKIRESRLVRARVIIEKLNRLGVPVTWEQVSQIAAGAVVGRPHVAQAMVETGAVASVEEAFTPEWIGPGGRAYEPKYALDPVRAIQLVRGAGGVTVLAHPRGFGHSWQVPDGDIERLAQAGLAGIEVDHPQQDEGERADLRRLARALALIPSGGSDDHGDLTGHRIGTEIAPEGSYEALIRQATGASPITGS